MKKWLSSIIMVSVMLMTLLFQQVDVRAAESDKLPVGAVTKSNWYNTVLNNKNKKWTVDFIKHAGVATTKKVRLTVRRGSFKYYYLKDINGDGVKELILCTNKTGYGDGSKILVLQYENGAIKARKAFANLRGGLFIKNSRVIPHFGCSTCGGYIGYNVRRSGLTQSFQLDSYRYYQVNRYIGKRYKYNKSNISYSRFDSLRSQYISGARQVTFTQIPNSTVLSTKGQNVFNLYWNKIATTYSYGDYNFVCDDIDNDNIPELFIGMNKDYYKVYYYRNGSLAYMGSIPSPRIAKSSDYRTITGGTGDCFTAYNIAGKSFSKIGTYKYNARTGKWTSGASSYWTSKYTYIQGSKGCNDTAANCKNLLKKILLNYY